MTRTEDTPTQATARTYIAKAEDAARIGILPLSVSASICSDLYAALVADDADAVDGAAARLIAVL